MLNIFFTLKWASSLLQLVLYASRTKSKYQEEITKGTRTSSRTSKVPYKHELHQACGLLQGSNISQVIWVLPSTSYQVHHIIKTKGFMTPSTHKWATSSSPFLQGYKDHWPNKCGSKGFFIKQEASWAFSTTLAMQWIKIHHDITYGVASPSLRVPWHHQSINDHRMGH